MRIDTQRAAAGLVLAAALTLASCGAPPKPPAPRPNGSVQPLRTGYWAGPMGENRIDFHIDKVLGDKVAIHISGGSLDPNARNKPGQPVTFGDRPTTCQINPDGTSFDCLRYKSMHVDNGFLCGVYGLYGQVYHPCFSPIE